MPSSRPLIGRFRVLPDAPLTKKLVFPSREDDNTNLMAKMIAYHCSHCSRDFEAEEREIVECPGCFWSTSVTRRDEVKTAAPSVNRQVPKAKPASFRVPAGVKKAFLILLLIALAGGSFIYWGPRIFSLLPKKTAEAFPKDKSTEPRDIHGPAGSPGEIPETPVLSDADLALLHSRVKLDPSASPGEEEKKILNQNAPLHTGFVEKLPSQAWSLEKFKSMLEEQEGAYKITFPRSYRGKLEDLFQSAYLPAQQAFESGDLLKARDLWVQSLAFPLYSDDIRKHRGVALTMLRPLINDTLSKIGALNQMAVEQQLRASEQSVGAAYQKFRDKIDAGDWRGGLQEAAQLESLIASVEKTAALEMTAPPYSPASAAGIDPDIQAALADILMPSRPAIADFRPLREDLQHKRDVIQGLIPESRAEQAKLYDQALERIDAMDWIGAKEKLKQIRFPPELERDARAKLKVLEEMR